LPAQKAAAAWTGKPTRRWSDCHCLDDEWVVTLRLTGERRVSSAAPSIRQSSVDGPLGLAGAAGERLVVVRDAAGLDAGLDLEAPRPRRPGLGGAAGECLVVVGEAAGLDAGLHLHRTSPFRGWAGDGRGLHCRAASPPRSR